MKVIKAVVVLLAAGLVAAPVVTMAQTSQAASAAAKAATHVVTAPTGPMKGMPEIVSAAEAPTSATTSGSFSRSCDSTVQTT